MYTPAAAALFVVNIIQHTRGRAILRSLGWSPIRPVPRTIWLAAIGLIGGTLLPIATVLLAAPLGFIHLDLVGFY